MFFDSFRKDFFDSQLNFSKIDTSHLKWGQYNLSILRMLSPKVSPEKNRPSKQSLIFALHFIVL